jgi:hypothetical protein
MLWPNCRHAHVNPDRPGGLQRLRVHVSVAVAQKLDTGQADDYAWRQLRGHRNAATQFTQRQFRGMHFERGSAPSDWHARRLHDENASKPLATRKFTNERAMGPEAARRVAERKPPWHPSHLAAEKLKRASALVAKTAQEEVSQTKKRVQRKHSVRQRRRRQQPSAAVTLSLDSGADALDKSGVSYIVEFISAEAVAGQQAASPSTEVFCVLEGENGSSDTVCFTHLGWDVCTFCF